MLTKQGSVFPDRTLAWVLHRDSLVPIELPVGEGELARAVERLLASVVKRRGARAIELASARLYDLLVRPLLPALRGGEPVVFVPDEALHAVPFAALWDRREGRYLIERRRRRERPSSPPSCGVYFPIRTTARPRRTAPPIASASCPTWRRSPTR